MRTTTRSTCRSGAAPPMTAAMSALSRSMASAVTSEDVKNRLRAQSSRAVKRLRRTWSLRNACRKCLVTGSVASWSQ